MTDSKVYLHHAECAVCEPGRAAPAADLESGTETVLRVEDGTMVRNILREGLETYGYTVLEAQDVADGLRQRTVHIRIHR